MTGEILFWFCLLGAVAILLAAGADANAEDDQGMTPRDLAAIYDRAPVKEALGLDGL